jgi:hypothetical protein
MPAANTVTPNSLALYVGPTSAEYTQGDLYKADATNNKWDKLTYNTEEIDALINSMGHFTPVGELPTTEIRTDTIYLVPETEDITGYTGSEPNGPVYVSTGTSSEPSYDKYEYNEVFNIYQFKEAVTGDDAATIKQAIDNDDYTQTTVTAQVHGKTLIQYVNPTGGPSGWIVIGDTEIDTDAFVKHEELVPITSAELAAMWED